MTDETAFTGEISLDALAGSLTTQIIKTIEEYPGSAFDKVNLTMQVTTGLTNFAADTVNTQLQKLKATPYEREDG